MLFKFAPKSGQVYHFAMSDEDMELDEVVEIEALTGKPISELAESLSRGSALMLKPMLYVYMKRSDPSLRYADFKVRMGEFGPVADRADLLSLRADVVANPAGHPTGLLEALDAQLAETPDPDVEPGKGAAAEVGDSPVPSNRAERRRASGRSTKKP